MTQLTVDSNNVLGKFVEESGKYNVKVLASSKDGASSYGDYMATLDYEVLDGDYQGGTIRFDNVVLKTDTAEALTKSAKRFNTVLVAAGVKDGVNLDIETQFVKGLIGKQMNISVYWGEPFNGKPSNLTVAAHNVFDPEGSKPDDKKRPGTSTNGATPVKNSGDPFAANGQEINISDDDLPF